MCVIAADPSWFFLFFTCSYQGIHELLAPIIFVLDSDKRDKDTVPVDQS